MGDGALMSVASKAVSVLGWCLVLDHHLHLHLRHLPVQALVVRMWKIPHTVILWCHRACAASLVTIAKTVVIVVMMHLSVEVLPLFKFDSAEVLEQPASILFLATIFPVA